MFIGLLHLHSFLRWIILLLLLVNIYKAITKKKQLGTYKWLFIAAHSELLIGLIQWTFGPIWGLQSLQIRGMSAVMQDPAARFFVIEHPIGMIIAITLISLGYFAIKKTGNTKKAAILYSLALLLIIALIPWPTTVAGIGRGWLIPN